MRNLSRIQAAHMILLASAVLGVSLGFMVAQTYSGEWMELFKRSREDLQVTAFFRNERLVVYITNLGSSRIEVQLIFLEGENYVDFEALTNVTVNPGETTEIQTNIMRPVRGTYTLRIKLSDGRTISYKITL